MLNLNMLILWEGGKGKAVGWAGVGVGERGPPPSSPPSIASAARSQTAGGGGREVFIRS